MLYLGTCVTPRGKTNGTGLD
eukprot:SAG11_NODE_37273_length_257_cov_1.639241_1_plen_20_part_10